MTNTIKEVQQQLVTKLKLVFTNNLFDKAIQDKKYQTLIEDELSILGQLKEKQLSTLVQSYNNATNKKFLVQAKDEKLSETTIIDKIKYFDIYTLNVYKLDINALMAGKNATVSSKEVIETNAPPVNPIPVMPSIGNIQEQMGMMQANMHLQQKILSGEIYMYKSKPKIVLILKWILAALLLLLALSCAFVSIGMFALDSGVIASWLNNGQPVDSNLKLNGISYLILFALAIFYAYQHFTLLVTTKSKKTNENKIYSFSWFTYIFLAVYIVFVIVFCGVQVDARILSVKAGQVFRFWWAGMWYLGYILLIISSICVIVTAGICAACKPQVDTERLNAIAQQILASAKATSSDSTTTTTN